MYTFCLGKAMKCLSDIIDTFFNLPTGPPDLISLYVEISKEVYNSVWMPKQKIFIKANDKLSNMFAGFDKKITIFNSL